MNPLGKATTSYAGIHQPSSLRCESRIFSTGTLGRGLNSWGGRQYARSQQPKITLAGRLEKGSLADAVALRAPESSVEVRAIRCGLLCSSVREGIPAIMVDEWQQPRAEAAGKSVPKGHPLHPDNPFWDFRFYSGHDRSGRACKCT